MVAEYDVVIVGGGIVGLATALSLMELSPNVRLAVIEKEPAVASHQSGHNSGIIHSGLYYEPGSLKARLCVSGADRMVAFCEQYGVPFGRSGKVVVATEEIELERLDFLHARGKANGLRGLRRLDRGELREVEPFAAGLAGLHVPTTGTVDFAEVASVMAEVVVDGGAEIVTGFDVDGIEVSDGAVVLMAEGRSVSGRGMVNCAGLQADRVLAMSGVRPPIRIIPFRGEYYDVVGASADLVRSSIYPVPDPRLPFLGVHLTRTVDGTVHAGPNAVLAGAREGYSWTKVRPRDVWDTVSYPGVSRLGKQHWRAGITEVARSVSRRRFAESVQALVPEVALGDLMRSGAGVRAQAVTPSGSLVDDFLIVPSPRAIHVLNAPSPGATSSLAIGEYIAARFYGSLGID